MDKRVKSLGIGIIEAVVILLFIGAIGECLLLKYQKHIQRVAALENQIKELETSISKESQEIAKMAALKERLQKTETKLREKEDLIKKYKKDILSFELQVAALKAYIGKNGLNSTGTPVSKEDIMEYLGNIKDAFTFSPDGTIETKTPEGSFSWKLLEPYTIEPISP